MEPDHPRPLSALPSVRARLLAFVAIVAAGIFGAMIGYSFVDLQCDGSCGTETAMGAIVGAVVSAAGVGVVSVLTLRAMGEWRHAQDRDEG